MCSVRTVCMRAYVRPHTAYRFHVQIVSVTWPRGCSAASLRMPSQTIDCSGGGCSVIVYISPAWRQVTLGQLRISPRARRKSCHFSRPPTSDTETGEGES